MREMTGEFNLKFDWAFNPGHKKGGCAIRIIFKWDRNILFVRNKLSRKCVEIRKSAVSALKLTYLKASRRGPDTAKVFVRLIFYWPCGQLFPPYPLTLLVKNSIQLIQWKVIVNQRYQIHVGRGVSIPDLLHALALVSMTKTTSVIFV